LQAAFELFPVLHAVLDNPEAVYRITTEVIEDFEAQNTVYLELRTVRLIQTPKKTAHMDKREYLEAVQSAIDNYRCSTVTKLLVSVDRGRGLEEAWENLRLAEDSRHCVGLDLSGDPRKAGFADYTEVFQAARDQGLKATVHTAEIDDQADTLNILNFSPERLGHCCAMDDASFDRLQCQRIPVELCPTSNMCAMGWSSFDQHHFSKLYAEGLPLSINTDDTLLFATDSSKEHYSIGQAFGLSLEDMKNLIFKSRSQIFWDEDLAERLRGLAN
jgi:adenosine deaminase